MDVFPIDRVAVQATFWSDGSATATLGFDCLDGLANEAIQRGYRPGVQAEEVIGEVCRLLAGFGAWGLMGVEEVRQALPHY